MLSYIVFPSVKSYYFLVPNASPLKVINKQMSQWLNKIFLAWQFLPIVVGVLYYNIYNAFTIIFISSKTWHLYILNILHGILNEFV